MRDPKTHAKVLALRWEEVGQAVTIASLRDDFLPRERLVHLRDRIHRANHAHRKATGWDYHSSANPPFWVHNNEIIPDTEEEA